MLARMTQGGLFVPDRPTAKTPAKPFLKWAGGKTRLIPDIMRLLPDGLTNSDRKFSGRYFEPFMGSAALFFSLSPRLLANGTFISDTNLELILTFVTVRDNLGALLDRLAEYDRAHNGSSSPQAQTDFYLQVRAMDRTSEWQSNAFRDPTKTVEHAARFIYLNRTCFNGLWRVNSRGHYNVPMGRYNNPGIYNPALLEQAHRALQGVRIAYQPFEVATAHAQAGDVVYFDPPYMPLSATSSFNAYAKDAFLKPSHRLLATVALILARRGVRVVVSNSDTPFTRSPLGAADDHASFEETVAPVLTALRPLYSEATIDDLFTTYRDCWNVRTVYAGRAINAKSDKRGAISEILIWM